MSLFTKKQTQTPSPIAAPSSLEAALTVLVWLEMRAETLRLDNRPEQASVLASEACDWYCEGVFNGVPYLDLDEIRAECQAKARAQYASHEFPNT